MNFLTVRLCVCRCQLSARAVAYGAIGLLINSPHPIQFGFLHTIYGVLLGKRNRAPGTNIFRGQSVQVYY